MILKPLQQILYRFHNLSETRLDSTITPNTFNCFASNPFDAELRVVLDCLVTPIGERSLTLNRALRVELNKCFPFWRTTGKYEEDQLSLDPPLLSPANFVVVITKIDIEGAQMVTKDGIS